MNLTSPCSPSVWASAVKRVSVVPVTGRTMPALPFHFEFVRFRMELGRSAAATSSVLTIKTRARAANPDAGLFLEGSDH